MWDQVCEEHEVSDPDEVVTYPQGWETAKKVLPVRNAQIEVEFEGTFKYYILEIEKVEQEAATRWFVWVRTPQQLFARTATKAGLHEKRPIVGPMELTYLPKKYSGKPVGYYPTISQRLPLYRNSDGRLYTTLLSVVEATGTPTHAIVRDQTMYLEPRRPADN